MPHNLIFSNKQAFAYRQKCMLFFVCLFEIRIVWQQSELCIFRCVASAAHFFHAFISGDIAVRLNDPVIKIKKKDVRL